ncbi:hypothetical protein ACFOOM_12265 [Streptomyces echinoruber]|uniref:Uncharacterized protein n=1 Tax=Streptomyces echinoruber TaxID=68898 RepID=A0A918VJN9_9ACTN|nr:hypothetical protein [Streptomyces echinoruber]GHA01297.1 hypothetical protein GCM10010389_45800 [Streptomyces echinoruber]
MIKALLRESTGAPVVVLGLSAENMTRLMADEPIVVQLAELGLKPMKVLIVGGRTEADIAAMLAEKFGPPRQTIHQEPDR